MAHIDLEHTEAPRAVAADYITTLARTRTMLFATVVASFVVVGVAATLISLII